MPYDQYEEYLKSEHWSGLRMRAINRTNRRCEGCQEATKLQGHHLRYRNLYNCTEEDVMALCEACHDLWHRYYPSSFEADREFVKGFLAGLREIGVKPKERAARGPKWPKVREQMFSHEGVLKMAKNSENYRQFRKKMRKLYKDDASISHFRHYMRKAFDELKTRH